MTESLYKILRRDEAAAAERADARSFHGTALDRRDGFIHLSYGRQVAGTLACHFRDADEVVLLRVEAAALPPGALRAEPSRCGELFPHLHAPLPWRAVAERLRLRRGADGAFVIPDHVHVPSL